METSGHKFTNQLIHESSPYLLQHAHNPVNWYPWGSEALELARIRNKLIVVSIGYAACHWCHVMEHESFENIEVAAYMNEHFICIKVDREERPDIDQVYMTAVQILTGRGGWPLNCIALPDGRPVYGGTYFPPAQWLDMLKQITAFVNANPEKAEQQAKALTEGVQSGELISILSVKTDYHVNDLNTIFNRWKNSLDIDLGGHKGAPKFPLPSGFQYLLQFGYITRNADALKAVSVTLNKMADGGIYDQIGGGFSRYSTDAEWIVPHFEKMLYDNAQLVSLYNSAYQYFKEENYKAIVSETLDFVKSELTSPESGFYSSLDADSEGEEGKFYTWTKPELLRILGTEGFLVLDYYSVTDAGNHENTGNVLYRSGNVKQLAAKYNLSERELLLRVIDAKEIMRKERAKRVRPGLDDKILTSWNALMMKAYSEAYRVFDNQDYLDIALKNAGFIVSKMKTADNRLYRNYKNGKTSINGFLDDYAFTIDAFISLYQATFDEQFIKLAHQLSAYVIEHFYDHKSGMFFYTSDLDPALIARKMEISDNVIPSSNSTMAKNLFMLGHYFGIEDFISMAESMVNNVKQNAMEGGPYYANWDILIAWLAGGINEIAIVGTGFEDIRKEFDTYYLPDTLFYGGKNGGTLPLLEGKFTKGQTQIYVCRDNVCNLPVHEVKEALKQIPFKGLATA